MTDGDDAMPAVGSAFAASTSATTLTDSTLAADVPAGAPPEAVDEPAPDDRAARRAALCDLAAMIGVEVFY